MAKKSQLIQNQKALSKKWFLLIVPLLLAFSLVWISYSTTTPSLIGSKYISALDNFFASMPLIPKTSRQILTKALIKNQELTNYELALVTKLENKKQEKIIDLKLTGKINDAGFIGSQSQTNIKGGLVEPVVGEVDIETFEDDTYFYFKPNKAPQVNEFTFSKVKSQWYKVDREKFQQSLGFKARTDNEVVSDIKEQFTKLQKETLFSKTMRKEDDKLKGENFYKISFNLDGETIKNPVFQENFKPAGYELTVWVNKKTFYITKVSLISKAKDSNINQEIKASFEYLISNIGERQKLNFPSTQEEIVSALDLGLLLKNASKEPTSEEFLDASVASEDLGQNFLILERFLKVLILLPKSI